MPQGRLPLGLFFLTTGWGSTAGGIQTVNRELCKAVGRASPKTGLSAWRVFCVACGAHPSAAEVEDARRDGATLIAGYTRPSDDASSYSDVEVPEFDAVGRVVLVGHGKFTGPAAVNAAERLRKGRGIRRYKAAALYMYHVHSADIEGLKGDSSDAEGLKRTLGEVQDLGSCRPGRQPWT